MELAYYPWFVLGHLVAARFNIYLQFIVRDLTVDAESRGVELTLS
jgi:hypothetical protein